MKEVKENLVHIQNILDSRIENKEKDGTTPANPHRNKDDQQNGKNGKTGNYIS